MTRKLGLTLATTLALTVLGVAVASSESVAREYSGIPTDISAAKKGPGGGGGGGQNAGRGGGGGGARNVGGGGGARNVGRGGGGSVMRSNVQRTVAPRSIQQNVGQRSIQRNFGQRNIQRSVGQRNIQRNVGQSRIQRNVGEQKIQRNIGGHNIGQQSKQARFGQVRIRDASRATIAGRNYSIWRGSHRVRRGGGWRTFVGLSTLSAIMFGTSQYYPYAYIDAPAPYCDGLTEDGCQLQWQEVPTLEGPSDFQCVAYCPWQQ